jgi:DNA-directed RNA polymerase specialized sigma subunit
MDSYNKIRKLLEKDWIIAIPQDETNIEYLAEVINKLSAKNKNIKIVKIKNKLSKVNVILIKKTKNIKNLLNFNKKLFNTLVGVIISPDKKIFSINSKTNNKNDKNEVIDDIIKTLTENIEAIKEKEKEVLSMYR